MKRLVAIALVGAMMIAALAGCKTNVKNDNKIHIVTTIFPVYDWVRNIVGDNPDVEVTMLLDSGADLHSFQPTAEDILEISRCDMFVYVGGESDQWVEDALKEKANEKMEVVPLMEQLGDKAAEEQVKEGMQDDADDEHGNNDAANEHVKNDADDEHGKNDADDEHGKKDEEVEYDEHIWLSIDNAKYLCAKIADKLAKVDKKDANSFSENSKKYIAQLDQLDKKFQKTVDDGQVKTIVVADRFPFLYMTRDYGIDYYAAFKGCSAETEASFKTIKFLANKIDEKKLNNILVIEGTNHKIADTVARATKTKKKKTLVLDSMQAITGEDAKSGASYIKAMEKNRKVLEQALNN